MKNRKMRTAMLCMACMMALQPVTNVYAGNTAKSETQKEKQVQAADTAKTEEKKKPEKLQLELKDWNKQELMNKLPAPKAGKVVYAWSHPSQSYGYVELGEITEKDYKEYIAELEKANFKEAKEEQKQNEQKQEEQKEQNQKEQKQKESAIQMTRLSNGTTDVAMCYVSGQMMLCIGKTEIIAAEKKLTTDELKKLDENKEKLSWKDLAAYMKTAEPSEGNSMAVVETENGDRLYIVGDRGSDLMYSIHSTSSGDKEDLTKKTEVAKSPNTAVQTEKPEKQNNQSKKN